jgi:putative ABC transport system ATP-binding protein
MTPLIHVKHLSKSYKNNEHLSKILNNVTFDVQKGEFVIIRGISGSGKTTLLNILSGLDNADQGIVKIGEYSLHEMSHEELRSFRANAVGFIFQFYHLIPTLTVLENILSSIEATRKVKSEDIEYAKKLAETVGLADKLHVVPTKLSGGQQQRVSIARALVKKPKIIFGDEPTACLDQENAKSVVGLMLKLRQQEGATFIIVTHDPGLSQYADRTYHLMNGFLNIENNTPSI